jgi:hypothetical protein
MRLLYSIILFFFLSINQSFAGDDNPFWANPYTSSDGTYVSGHWRYPPGFNPNLSDIYNSPAPTDQTWYFYTFAVFLDNDLISYSTSTYQVSRDCRASMDCVYKYAARNMIVYMQRRLEEKLFEPIQIEDLMIKVLSFPDDSCKIIVQLPAPTYLSASNEMIHDIRMTQTCRFISKK